jgi:hypothetical protein
VWHISSHYIHDSHDSKTLDMPQPMAIAAIGGLLMEIVVALFLKKSMDFGFRGNDGKKLEHQV